MHGTSEPHCPQLRPIYNCCTQYKYWLYKRNGEAGMDLNSLQVFLTVARERSFSRAAEKLYRTQPAISISVRKLEEWVGQPLFVRGTGARTLTEAGVLLIEYAERMLNLREEARRSLEDLAGLRRGRPSLGVNESSIHALLPALARFRRKFPKVEIAIHRVYSRDIPRDRLAKKRRVSIRELGDEIFIAHIVASPYRDH